MAAILKLIITTILTWLLERGATLVQKFIREKQAENKRESENSKVREDLEKAEAPKEREDAAKQAIDRF